MRFAKPGKPNISELYLQLVIRFLFSAAIKDVAATYNPNFWVQGKSNRFSFQDRPQAGRFWKTAKNLLIILNLKLHVVCLFRFKQGGKFIRQLYKDQNPLQKYFPWKFVEVDEIWKLPKNAKNNERILVLLKLFCMFYQWILFFNLWSWRRFLWSEIFIYLWFWRYGEKKWDINHIIYRNTKGSFLKP